MAGTPCRPSINQCDLPEFCGGTSPFCPSDFYMMDGLPCANNAAFCFEGRCQTFDYQCKQLFGSGTSHCSGFYLFILGDHMSLSVCQNAVNLQMTCCVFKFYTKTCFLCISGYSVATKADDKCFSHVNTLGNTFGNCGYSGSNPKPCEVQ